MSTTTRDEGSLRTGRWLRRYSVLILLVTLAFGTLAAVYAVSRPQSYSSSAQILLRPSVGNPFNAETGSSSQQITTAVATESALVTSDEVLALASDSTGTALGAADVAAVVPPNTSTIVITVRSTFADDAAEEAQAMAESFLQYREQVSQQNQDRSAGQLRDQIIAVQQSLEGTGRSDADVRRADVLTAQLVALQSALVATQSAATDPGTLVAVAGPVSRDGIATPVLAVGGLLAGLILGVAAAFALARRDTSIRAESDATVAGLPVLTTVGSASDPRLSSDDLGADEGALQQLRTFLVASCEQPSAIAISGVGPADRSGDVARVLGRSMARAGYRVAVVLADPAEAGAFGERAGVAPGLAEAVLGQSHVVDLVIEQDGVEVLSPGRDLADQHELLSGRRFQVILGTLKEAFDYVLVVTGPATVPAELAVGRAADAMVLVATEGGGSSREVRDLADRADLLGLPVLGLVLRARGGRDREGRGTTVAADSQRARSPQQSAEPLRSSEDRDDPTGPTDPQAVASGSSSSEVADPVQERPSIFRW